MKQLITRFLVWLARKMGPYRAWRVVHEMAASDPRLVQEFAEFVLKNELPARPLSPDFLAFWMDDALLIRVLRQRTVTLGSPFYPFLMHRQVAQRCAEAGLLPKSVLELGPGIHLGALFCFAASGCPRVAGVDVEPAKPDPEFYQNLKAYLGAVSGFQWWRYNAAVNPYPELSYPDLWEKADWKQILDRIDYRSPVSAERLPFADAEFDLVYSITALEHFPDAAGAIREIHRVLQPGGLTVHEIDFRHHVDMRVHKPKEALRFLGWTDEEHRKVSEEYGGGRGLKTLLAGEWGREVYCNRLRLSDCVELFKKQGFELLKVEPVEVLDPKEIDRDSFVEPFRSKSLEDLSVLMARIVARKL